MSAWARANRAIEAGFDVGQVVVWREREWMIVCIRGDTLDVVALPTIDGSAPLTVRYEDLL